MDPRAVKLEQVRADVVLAQPLEDVAFRFTFAFSPTSRFHSRLPGHVSGSLATDVVVRVPPRSAAERWAVYVLKGCDAEGDLKTLASWARLVGVSYTSLGESSRILQLRPHDARDLMRALRALFKSQEYECPPDVLLDLSDRRTLRTFLRRSGEGFRRGSGGEWVDRFLRHQTFIPAVHVAVTTLRALCLRRVTGKRPTFSVESSDQIRYR